MPKDFSRTRRVGEQLQRELAVLVRDEIDDPRIGMVSISGVEVSRDLSHAKVFFSTMATPGKEHDTDISLQVLTGAAGFLRRLLGQNLAMRRVPQLHFKRDKTLEQGAYLSALIDSAVNADKHTDDDSGSDN